MSWTLVISICVALLLVGAMIGLVRAESRASLRATISAAVLLGVVAAGILPFEFLWVVFGSLLAAFFAFRLAKPKRFIPAGMLLMATMFASLASSPLGPILFV